MTGHAGTTITAAGQREPTSTAHPMRTWSGYGPAGAERRARRNCCRQPPRRCSSPTEKRAPTVYTAKGARSEDGRPVEVADEVGAGDTFVAAVLASLWNLDLPGHPERLDHLDLGDWSKALRLAVAASSITCSRPGADPPYLAELPPGMAFWT